MFIRTDFATASLGDRVKPTSPKMNKENYLIASLPPSLYQKLAPHFQPVFLKQGVRLQEADETLKEVYFPIDSLISITITMMNGTIVETGMVGCRDLLSINALVGSSETKQTDCTVQIAGNAIKIKAKILREEFASNQQLRDLLLRYTQAFIVQVSQTAACNATHPLEHRFAHWLLRAQACTSSGDLQLTHEFIANMLAVRRSGVTQAAQSLQDRGLIRYKRGHIHILNQTGLEAASCECFKVVRDEYDRLLGTKYPRSV